MWITLHCLCLVTAAFCNEGPNLENTEDLKESLLSRRAIDGTRGRKYYNPEEDGLYDSYGSSGGQYDSDQTSSGFSDIRRNIPGEPGVDYPAYTSLPQTRFSCEGRVAGYYADEDAGCQVFHVCHDIKVSSFICPVGSIFNQKLLTCDWWSKVDCASTQSFYSLHQETYNDDDEMVQKAYSMMKLPPGSESEFRDRKVKKLSHSTRGNELTYSRESLQGGPNFNYDVTSSQNRFDNSDPSQEVLQSKGFAQSYGNQYENSPIVYIQRTSNDYDQIRHQSGDDTIFPNSYEEHITLYGGDFQPSYAPTVPTVTTTTRKLYSPTVPTTYRPATVAYHRFDQEAESSDHLYTHSKDIKTFTTQPTITDQYPEAVNNGNNDLNSQQQNMEEQKHNFQALVADSKDQSGKVITESKESIGTSNDSEHKLEQIANYVEAIARDQRFRNSNAGFEQRNSKDEAKANPQTAEIGDNRSVVNGNSYDVVGETIYQSYQSHDTTTPNYQHFYHDQLLQSPEYKTPQNDVSVLEANGQVPFVAPGNNPGNGFQDYYIEGTTTGANEKIYDYPTLIPPLNQRNLEIQNSSGSQAEDASNAKLSEAVNVQSHESIISTTTNTPTLFTFSGQYQRPAPFSFNQDTTRPTVREFSIAPTTPKPAYDSGIAFGSRIQEKATTIKPVEFLEPSANSNDRRKLSFRINVPDMRLTNEDQNTVGKANTYSAITDNINEESITVSSVINQNPVSSRVIAEFSTTEYVQDAPSTVNSFDPKPTSFDFSRHNGPLAVEHNANQEISTVSSHQNSPSFIDHRATVSDGNSESTTESFLAKADLSSYILFKQASDLISPFANQPTSTVSPIRTDGVTKKSAQYNSELQFSIRNALTNPTSTISPVVSQFNQPSTLPVYQETKASPAPLANEETFFHTTQKSVSPENTNGFGENVPVSESYKVVPTSERYLTTTPRFESSTNHVQSSFGGFVNTGFEGSTLRNSLDVGVKPTEKVQSLKSIAVQTTTSRTNLPENLSQVEASIANNNNSPYQVSLTVNGDEGFNPSGNFISRLLSQHERNDSTEAANLGSFEVVRSESPEESKQIDAPLPRQNFDLVKSSTDGKEIYNEKSFGGGNFGHNSRSEGPRFGKKIEVAGHNLNSGPSDAKDPETPNMKIESSNVDNFPRPFSLGNAAQGLDFRSRLNSVKNDLSIINPPNPDAPQLQKAIEFSNFRTEGKDISEHLTSLFGSAPKASAIYPPLKDQILDELAKNLGQPLYNPGQQEYFGLPDERRALDFRTGLPYANLQQYQAGRNSKVNERKILAGPTPKPTTTTPKPVKTVVETEFVPSLGFSFDTDEGRKEYVEAVLRGLLANADGAIEDEKKSRSSE